MLTPQTERAAGNPAKRSSVVNLSLWTSIFILYDMYMGSEGVCLTIDIWN